MLKRIIFNVHWLLGITLGVALALIGLTGATMAFEEEILAAINGTPLHLSVQGARLPPQVLLERARVGHPGRIVAGLVLPRDETRPVEVLWTPDPSRNGAGGLSSALLDPYTGATLEVGPQRGAEFMRQVQFLHRRLVFNPSMGKPSRVAVDAATGKPYYVGGEREVTFAESVTSWCVLALMILVLSGLYLRWPRGRAARQWRSWLSINWRLKGAAFLWPLHAVAGTILLGGFLMSAHSGLAMSEIHWYADGFERLAGDAYRHGQLRSAEVRAQRAAENLHEYDLARLWAAFQREVPRYDTATVELSRSTPEVLQVAYLGRPVAHGEVSGRDVSIVRLDATSGRVLTHERFADKPLLQRLVLQNFDIHSGNILGTAGRVYVMLSSLTLPLMMVTGWMLYLKRRARKARAALTAGCSGSAGANRTGRPYG